jgi:hypothetical protein
MATAPFSPGRGHARTSPKPDTQLVDELLARYVEWREDAAAVADAHRRWRAAPAGERALAFAAYRAAVDREESAAAGYGAAVDALRSVGGLPAGS